MPLEDVTESGNSDVLSAKGIFGLARLDVAIEAITRIDVSELIRRARRQRACCVRRSIEGVVVVHHHHAVSRKVNVELYAIGAE